MILGMMVLLRVMSILLERIDKTLVSVLLGKRELRQTQIRSGPLARLVLEAIFEVCCDVIAVLGKDLEDIICFTEESGET